MYVFFWVIPWLLNFIFQYEEWLGLRILGYFYRKRFGSKIAWANQKEGPSREVTIRWEHVTVKYISKFTLEINRLCMLIIMLPPCNFNSPTCIVYYFQSVFPLWQKNHPINLHLFLVPQTHSQMWVCST